MLNYFNFKQINDETYLLTSDFGRFAFLSAECFKTLLSDPTRLPQSEKDKLIDAGIYFETSVQAFLEKNFFSLRETKRTILSPTGLHIFVVTNQCNLNCVYCQANDGRRLYQCMNEETADKAVDIALSSPGNEISFEFQGGEPLVNYAIIKHIILTAEEKKGDKIIHYSVVTNLTLLTDEMIDFFAVWNVHISTSIDGDEITHNHNRPFVDGRGSFEKVYSSVTKLRSKGISAGAIETTTRFSLRRAEQIIRAYTDFGFSSIFLRPLSPLGCARLHWNEIGYTAQEFLDFYIDSLEIIFRYNQKGIRIQENYASILLSKILHQDPVNYMELRSPCGASVGQMTYYCNGDVFTCDEGRMLYEMGNDSFKVGNVFDHSYQELVHSQTTCSVCKASITEAVPQCCNCVYQPYCGICPAINMSLYGDLLPKEAHDYKCRINMGIMDYLFSILNKPDDERFGIITQWRV